MNLAIIERLLRESRYVDDNLTINFSISGDAVQDTDEEGTDYELVSCKVDSSDKSTGENLSFVTDLVKLPIKTPTGYKVKGKFKQVVSAYVLSNGWYMYDADKNHDTGYLKARARGFSVKIYTNANIFYIENGKKKIPLAMFLKAITRKSYQELMLLLGPENLNVILSFDPASEPNLVVCMRETLSKILDYKNYQQNEIGKMTVLQLETEIRRRLYNSNFVDMGDTCAIRLSNAILYQERCKGLYLENSIDVNGYSFEADQSLSARELEQLDYLPVKELKVYSLEKKEFISRKYHTHNFQVLGRVLAETIESDDFKIEAGTTLTISLIKKIEATSIRTIAVEKPGGVEYVSRPLSGNEFSNGDFIAILQVYMDFLNGIRKADDSTSLANQNLIDLDIKGISVIKQNCESIVRALKENHSSYDSIDLLTNALHLDRVNVDGILEYMASPATKESQQAEVNNTIQRVSKDFRVSKDVNRGTDAMVAVSDSQFGALDPMDTPESSKVGLTQVRTIFSRINEYGFAEAPFIRVNNGVVESSEIVYLSADRQKGTPYAEWNETFYTFGEDGEKVLKDLIVCMQDGELVRVPIAEVQYMQYSPFDTMSPARATINLVNHSAPKRQTMGSNHVKSSHVVLRGERPWVTSGGDSLLKDGLFKVQHIIDSVALSHTKFRNLDKDSAKNIKMVLRSKSIEKDFMKLFFDVPMLETTVEFSVPYMIKSSSGAVFSTRVNALPNLTYGYDDIVAYTTDYDIRNYDLEMFANFGNMKVEEGMFDQAFGIGKNVCVAFKTQESSTIDDSIYISSDLIGTDDLTSVLVTQVTYELREPKRDEKSAREEYEEFVSLKSQGTFLPAVNSIIQPGGEVLRVARSVRVVTDNTVVEVNYNSIPYEGLEEAQVFSAEIKGDQAIVTLVRQNTVETGDKLSGRHGSKSVIAKIVPPQYMPYCPKTGLVAEVLINPLSIPSRANVSIPIEAAIAFASKLKKKVTIISPFKDNVLEYALEQQREYDLYPRTLVDGRTGLRFDRPINLGFMYIYKSEHMVDKKIKAVGDNSPMDPLYGQPSKGDGAQAQGEMETWVYMNKGANNIMQYMFSTGSSDAKSLLVRRSKIEIGDKNLLIEGNNSNDEILQILFRSCGLEVSVDKDFEMSFKPLTNKMITSLSTFAISPGAYDKLRSTEIFGSSKGRMRTRKNWGWFQLGAEIIHPYVLIKAKLHSFFMVRSIQDKESKLFTTFEVGTPGICREKDIIDLIYSESTLYTQEGRTPIIVNNSYFEEILEKHKESPNSVNISSLEELDEYTPVTGMQAVVYLFRNSDLDKTCEYYQNRIDNTRSEERALDLSESLNSLLKFKKSGTSLEDFIIESFPVVPLAFRPESNQHQAKQDLDHYYSRIMDAANKCLRSPAYNPSLVKDLCERINDFLGVRFKGKESGIKEKVKYKPLLRMFTSSEGKKKKGDLREHVAKTRVLNSGRTVIVPNSDPKRTPEEIGVPLYAALKMWRSQIVALLMESFQDIYDLSEKDWDRILEVMPLSNAQFRNRVSQTNMLNDDQTYEDVYALIYKKIAGFVEGIHRFSGNEDVADFTVVQAGRQPTLHEFSIRAYRPYLVTHKCIEIHPLVCPAYNADFDGDQMYLIAMIGRKEKEEALDLFSPLQSNLNPKDGSIVLKPSQDIVLGIYYLTIFKDNIINPAEDEYYNAPPKHYSDIDALELDLSAKHIMPYDFVVFNHKGKLYPSTAGRILLNSLIPDYRGFTSDEFVNHSNFKYVRGKEKGREHCGYYALKFDGIVANPKGDRKGIKYSKLNTVITYVIRNFSKRAYLDFSQKLTEVGFFYSDRSGISISLDDFKQRDRTQEIIAKADKIAATIDTKYRLGMLSEDERKTEMISLYATTHSKVKEDYLAHIDQNNNLYIMFDSGARGDAGQITQACAMVGILQKNKSETLEFPIKSSYIRGLSCFESLNTSYSARLAISSTQNETEKAGEITRLAVYMMEGVKIVEKDCGCGYHDTKLDLGEFTNRIIKDGNHQISYDVGDLVGKTLLGPELALKYIKHFSEANKLNAKNINLLVKNKIQRIQTSDGEYQFMYKSTGLFASMYYYRSAQNLPHLIEGKFISEETLSWLAENQPERFAVRDMLRCKSVGGVCQLCYGAEYDSVKYPRIGHGVAIRSAQSIGEPAAQITMNVHNKGGAAGEAPNQGVAFYQKVLKQGIAGSEYKGPPVAPVSGYIGISANGFLRLEPEEPLTESINKNHWHMQGDDLVLRASNPSVSVGEYVSRNQVLGQGTPQTRELLSGMQDDTFYLNQLNLLRWHYETFEKSNIQVYARHFEIIARVQTSLVTITHSDNDDYIPGSLVFKAEVDKLIESGSKIRYTFTRQGSSKIIQKYSGALTAMIHGDLGKTFGDVVTTQEPSRVNSPIAKLVSGQPIHRNTPKAFTPIDLSESHDLKEETVVNEVDSLKFLAGVLKEVETTVQTQDLDFDLDDLLGVSPIPTPPQEILEPSEELPELDTNLKIEGETRISSFKR